MSEQKVELLKKLWHERNPYHEANLDTEEDMFWQTVLCVFYDFVSSQLSAPNTGKRGVWQLCPKCLGNGWTPTTGGYQTSTTEQCNVCYGAKILASPETSSPISVGDGWVKKEDHLKEVEKYKEHLRTAAYTIWKGCESSINFDEWRESWLNQNDLLPPPPVEQKLNQ